MDAERERAVKDVEELGQEWAAAERRGDAEVLDRLLADDFVGIGPRGFMLTKEQWLARFTSGDLRYDAFTWDDVRVRVYGDAAVAIGRQTQAGNAQGHDVRAELRVTQVLVKQGGRWRLAGIHLSPIAGPLFAEQQPAGTAPREGRR